MTKELAVLGVGGGVAEASKLGQYYYSALGQGHTRCRQANSAGGEGLREEGVLGLNV